MTEAFEKFIARVDRLEERYKGHDYADAWLMPRDLLIAVRDEIKQPTLFGSALKTSGDMEVPM